MVMIPGGLLLELARVGGMLMVAALLCSMKHPTHLHRPLPSAKHQFAGPAKALSR